jgi:hypothetical protein
LNEYLYFDLPGFRAGNDQHIVSEFYRFKSKKPKCMRAIMMHDVRSVVH